MTYADKYGKDRYSTYRFYRDIRLHGRINLVIGGLYPNVLDHIVLDDGDVNTYIIREVTQSPSVDDAVASIQRFASRCLATGKSKMMVNMMSQIIMEPCALPKPIIDIFLSYGAELDPNSWSYFSRACICGMRDDVKLAIEKGHKVSKMDVAAAVGSGDSDVVELVFGACRESVQFKAVMTTHVTNATVQLMELCMSLNIIQRGTHYPFSKIPSLSVLCWILDHDMMKDDAAVVDIASSASRYSGHYFDMLRYLIEQRNFTVPRDILIKLDYTHAVDLDVFDYLVMHGADVNASIRGRSVLEHSPMLARYWTDKGFSITSIDTAKMLDLMRQGMTASVLMMMIDIYSFNVNAVDRDGNTLLHEACRKNDYEVAEMLIHHGADINMKFDKRTPYLCTFDDRVKQLLISHGYEPSIRM